MACVTETRVHIVVNFDGRDSEHVCDDCLTTEDQTEGTLANYGDESCDRCEFHSGEEEDEEEDDE
jgi:hypothetical protein